MCVPLHTDYIFPLKFTLISVPFKIDYVYLFDSQNGFHLINDLLSK